VRIGGCSDMDHGPQVVVRMRADDNDRIGCPRPLHV
jgi:hypothetical protein